MIWAFAFVFQGIDGPSEYGLSDLFYGEMLMDFGGGFATGIAVGMGSGIASGVATGRSKMRKQIRSHIDQSAVTIQDRYGKPIKLDEFLEDACGPEKADCSKTKTWAIVAAGLAVLVALAVVFVLNR